MKFFKKKEEPKKHPKTLLEEYLEKCDKNTKNILQAMAKKREELFRTDSKAKSKEKEIDAVLDSIADFLTGIDWEPKIQQALDSCRIRDIDDAPTDRIDKEPFIYCLNLYWASAICLTTLSTTSFLRLASITVS